MVPISSLWLPIVLSAAMVFVLSFILHMVLPFHRADYRKVPSEDQVMESLRRFNLPPGDYMMPAVGAPAEMKSPASVAKRNKGPVAVITVMRSGPVSMGPTLVQWFIYCLIVSLFAAYITGRALGAGEPYLHVFQFAGATAFIGYTLALWQHVIWYKRSLGTTVRYTVDGLIYACFTAGVFGWLWPHMM